MWTGRKYAILYASMEPSEFLSRDAFARLSDDEAQEYVEQFASAFPEDREAVETSEWLEFMGHQLELLEWTVSPEEFYREVRQPFWNAIWENAESHLASLVELKDSAELTPSERTGLLSQIAELEIVIEHKRSLAELDETSD